MKPIERFLRETDRVPLMPMPTPLHPMHYQPSGKDVSLFIKRDDMTGVGPGGNKIRSLEFLLGEARSRGASKILAAGPEQSNLCALTAAACAKAGLDCELIINAAEPARKEGNLLLEELLGTKIHFLGSCDGAVRNRRMEELAAAYQSAGEQIYVVRNGATTRSGRVGLYRRGGGNEAAVRESWNWPHDDFRPRRKRRRRSRADLRKSADGPALPHCDRQRRG